MTLPPNTGKALVAYVESCLSAMSADQRKSFWLLITHHKDNSEQEEFLGFFTAQFEEQVKQTLQSFRWFIQHGNDLYRQLQRHRKPKKNAERDAEIMRLHGEGNTAGQIVRALKHAHPKLNDKSVNAVISRERRKPKPD